MEEEMWSDLLVRVVHTNSSAVVRILDLSLKVVVKAIMCNK